MASYSELSDVQVEVLRWLLQGEAKGDDFNSLSVMIGDAFPLACTLESLVSRRLVAEIQGVYVCMDSRVIPVIKERRPDLPAWWFDG